MTGRVAAVLVLAGVAAGCGSGSSSSSSGPPAPVERPAAAFERIVRCLEAHGGGGVERTDGGRGRLVAFPGVRGFVSFTLVVDAASGGVVGAAAAYSPGRGTRAARACDLIAE